MKIRIACIQSNPIIGHVEQNIARIECLLNKVKEADFVLLPEFAITGYNFSNKAEIVPFLEPTSNGRSTELAKRISRKLNCFTLIGYPERAKNEGAADHYTIYNSAVLTSPVGNVLYNYRKTHLYETDESFGCKENPESNFASIQLILDKEYYIAPDSSKKYRSITTNIGICMDLNPYKFEAPFNKYEFSMSCYANKSRLILCPMAWLSPDSPSLLDSEKNNLSKMAQGYSDFFIETASKCVSNFEPKCTDEYPHDEQAEQKALFKLQPEKPRYSTINYWILRFFPFLNHPYNNLPKYHQNVWVVTCNRVGLESHVLYGGSSSIIQFRNVPGNSQLDNRNGSVEVLGSLSEGYEGILLREIEIEDSDLV